MLIIKLDDPHLPPDTKPVYEFSSSGVQGFDVSSSSCHGSCTSRDDSNFLRSPDYSLAENIFSIVR